MDTNEVTPPDHSAGTRNMIMDTNEETPLPAWVERELRRLGAAANKRTWEELEAALRAAQATGDAEIAHGKADELLCIGLIKAGGGRAGISHMKRLVSIWLQVEKWYA